MGTVRTTPVHGAGERVAPGAWWSLLAVALGVMVVQLDATIVSVANPAIAADLGAGPQGIGWVTTAYLLVFAGLLVPAGTVADRIGRKRAFLVGIGGFSLASLVCGLAASIEWLVTGRVLQAVFAALLGPAGLALVRAAFPPTALPRALGLFGAVTAAALAGGPMLGGLLVAHASWPWVFLVNLPVGAVGLVVGARVLRESRADAAARLDVAGASTLTLAMLALVWGVSGAAQAGWVSATTFSVLALAVASFAAFVAVERRVRHPMVPLSLFRDRSFAVGCALMVITMLAFFAVLFHLTFFLQGVQGRGPVATGVALLPLTAVFTVASPLAGWVTDALGHRGTLVLGSVALGVALLALRTLDVDSGLATLVPALLLAGAGAGFLLVPAIGVMLGSAPVAHAGVAAGVQQSAQQLGSTLGVAVFGSVLASAVTARLPGALASSAPGDAAARRLGDDPALRESVALGFPPGAQDALSDGIADAVTDAAHQTFVSGLHTVFGVAAVCALAPGALALFVRAPRG